MWVLLSIILALGGFFRVWGTNHVPPELFGDEVDVGYQSYSLLKTGRDIYNQLLPTYIRSLSESRAPLLMYATVPTVAALGLNEWGVRLPPVIFGIVSILALAMLAYTTTRSRTVAVFSAACLAFMPWHIQYSRAGFEVTLLLTLIILGSTLYLRKRQVLACIFFALTVYTYSTAVVFVPLLILGLWILTRPKILSWGLAVFIVLLLPFLYQTLRGQTGNRFSQISLISGTNILDDITNGRIAHPGLVGRILYNRPAQYLSIFTRNYFQTFSTEFLFLRGDPVYRHSVQIVGELLPVTAVFLLIGVAVAFKKKEWFWLLWLFLAPVASALTVDGGYHATRNFLLVVPLAVLVAMGIRDLKNHKIILVVLLGVFVMQFTNFYYYYQSDYPKKSWRWWAVGYQDTFTALDKISPSYSRVFINNTYEPSLIRFLFWTKYDPAKFHKEFTLDQPTKNIVTNYDGFSLDGKYFFGNFAKTDWTNTLLPNSLYLISQRENVPGDWDWRVSPPGNISVLHTSVNPYNQPVFYLITKK